MASPRPTMNGGPARRESLLKEARPPEPVPEARPRRKVSFLPASAKLLQFLAASGNLQSLRFHFKAEPMTDFIFEPFDFIALELDDSFTILADDVAMVGMVGVVRIVEFVVLAEIHLPYQSALRQQRQSAINRRTGNRFVPPPRPFEQLLGGEMLVGAENAVDDGLPLRSEP